MNPTIQAERLARERRLDPARFAREYEAEFAEELDSFLPFAWVDDAVRRNRFELPPLDGVRYHDPVDPSRGGPDAFAVAIVHGEGSQSSRRIVVDVVKGWTRKGVTGVDLAGVVAEIASILKRYRITRATDDRYAGQWVRQAFGQVGVSYVESSPDKSAAFLEIEPLFAQGQIDLVDHPQLTTESKALERRLRAGGRTLVDHPRGGHDDYATAVALAAVECRAERVSTLTPAQILRVGRSDTDRDDAQSRKSFFPRL